MFVNDHVRQGLLAIERTWHTMSWAMRVFGTMFGVMVTNAYDLHKFDCKDANIEPTDFYVFVDLLGSALIDLPPKASPSNGRCRCRGCCTCCRDIRLVPSIYHV